MDLVNPQFLKIGQFLRNSVKRSFVCDSGRTVFCKSTDMKTVGDHIFLFQMQEIATFPSQMYLLQSGYAVFSFPFPVTQTSVLCLKMLFHMDPELSFHRFYNNIHNLPVVPAPRRESADFLPHQSMASPVKMLKPWHLFINDQFTCLSFRNCYRKIAVCPSTVHPCGNGNPTAVFISTVPPVTAIRQLHTYLHSRHQ